MNHVISEGLLNDIDPRARSSLTSDPTKWTHEQFLKWQVEEYNKSKVAPKNGYNCVACFNRGYFALINSAGNFALRPCTCLNIQRQISAAKTSGFGDMLQTYVFETYEAKDEWQQKLKRGAMLYTQQSDLPWLYIGGQSGAGKSHICTAAATRLLQQGKVVKYVMWRDVFRKMESYRYEEEKYNAILKELEEVEVLVIDDFLKGMDISKQGSALEIAFDVINRRYNNKRPTIISSELQLVEVERLDKALFGRIKERCGKFALNIKNDDDRNYRARNKVII